MLGVPATDGRDEATELCGLRTPVHHKAEQQTHDDAARAACPGMRGGLWCLLALGADDEADLVAVDVSVQELVVEI